MCSVYRQTGRQTGRLTGRQVCPVFFRCLQVFSGVCSLQADKQVDRCFQGCSVCSRQVDR